MARIHIEGLQTSFGRQVVLDVDELEIHDGEFFSLLGPSGCGKTTMLRSIAGLIVPDRGRVSIGGREVTGVPTWQRNLGMVFQKYALFPHLTVSENVAYGLRERGLARDDIDRRVAEGLALMSLPDSGPRYPHQLSGGQQQRVAMARAVVYRPDVLLLDEPLSNLDARLRVAMRAELKRLQQALCLTTIFVTHDQQEALALSDRIGVMRDGRMEQVGAPEAIYDAPQTMFVADFVGGTNLLTGVVRGPGPDAGTLRVEIDGAGVIAAVHAGPLPTGAAVRVLVKPERIRVGSNGDDPHAVRGEVVSAAYLGSAWSYIVRAGAQQLEARCAEAVRIDGRPVRAGDPVALEFDRGSPRVIAS